MNRALNTVDELTQHKAKPKHEPRTPTSAI